jgi:hypothetical protein
MSEGHSEYSDSGDETLTLVSIHYNCRRGDERRDRKLGIQGW